MVTKLKAAQRNAAGKPSPNAGPRPTSSVDEAEAVAGEASVGAQSAASAEPLATPDLSG